MNVEHVNTLSMRRLVGLIVATALLIASCGLPTDESPREYSLDNIPQELWPGQLPTPTPQGLAVGGEQVHMIGPGNRLELVQRPIADNPRDLLQVLINGTFPDETASGVTSALNNRTTRIQSVSVDQLFQLATVDLAPGSLDSPNSEQKLAFAQIVFTLTSLEDVAAVSFVQSDPDDPDANVPALSVQTDSGTTLPGKQVTREDFASVRPLSAGEQPQINFDAEIDAGPEPELAPETTARLWFIDQNDELRSFAALTPASASGRVASLLAGVPEPAQSQLLRSSLSPEAWANSVTVTDVTVSTDSGETDRIGIAIVDLGAVSLPPQDVIPEHDLAIAQIVYTLTELAEVQHVVLSVNGTQEGAIGYSRADFAAFDPNYQPPATPTPDLLDQPESEFGSGTPVPEGEARSTPLPEPQQTAEPEPDAEAEPDS